MKTWILILGFMLSGLAFAEEKKVKKVKDDEVVLETDKEGCEHLKLEEARKGKSSSSDSGSCVNKNAVYHNGYCFLPTGEKKAAAPK